MNKQKKDISQMAFCLKYST